MNILFITADQWRGECLSATGHPIVKTPNLDALAADGVVFRHHYGQAVPCGPSRACLYTGMYLHNHRSLLNGTPLAAHHTNVALEARKKGYEPALFGYTDVSLDPRYQNVVDDYEGILPGMDPICHMDGKHVLWRAHLGDKGYNVGSTPIETFSQKPDHPGSENKGQTFAPTSYSAEHSNTAFLVDKLIDYLSGQAGNPWFVHASFLSPHPPFVVPEPYHDMFDEKDMPLPIRRETWQEEVAQHPWLKHYLTNKSVSAAFTSRPETCDRISLSDLELRQIKASYYGMMAEVDAQIGRLIDHLKQTDTYHDTMIVFTSDHGENLGDHWAHSKYTYFEETFHVPLIIRDPSSEADQTRGLCVDAFTESVDIMPSILEAIGADVPLQCDGHSLLPFCRSNQPESWRSEAHMEFDLRAPYDGKGVPPLGLKMDQCSVSIIRGERYKYIHFAALPPLLFDLQTDPDEFHNLADDPAYQGIKFELAGKLLSWRMEKGERALTDLHVTSGGTIVNGMRSR